MTGEKINSLVGDLVAMARAMEQQPELEQRIRDLESNATKLAQANVALEDSNNILRSHIDELNLKIGEVTRERDDASFRVLETEDKAAQALDLCKTLQTGLGQVIAKLEPPKAEPVTIDQFGSGYTQAVVGEALRSQPEVSVSQDPTTASIQEPIGGTVDLQNAPRNEDAFYGMGQSDPLPTSTVESTSGEIGQQGSSVNVPPPNGPYTGKRWSELPQDQRWGLSYSIWLDGGGTYEGWNG
jgi:hypothetical protein